jgi:lipid II:glycine glycyltransferase (peptidoglycan interpeptide bridge formation enzyme)
MTSDVDTLWRKLKGVFRNQVRQAVRRGLTVRPLLRHELRDFFMMHVRLRKRKYGIFAQPYRFFEVVWEEFMAHDKGFILGAFAPDGRLIGGTMYLVCGEILYYKINTSTLDSLEYRSNNLLLWEGIRMARERGLKFVDLGSSGLKQDGLVAFKDSTGAKRMEIVHIGYHPQGYVFSQKRILKVYTKFFNAPSVPDRVTCWGSSLIYHFLA